MKTRVIFVLTFFILFSACQKEKALSSAPDGTAEEVFQNDKRPAEFRNFPMPDQAAVMAQAQKETQITEDGQLQEVAPSGEGIPTIQITRLTTLREANTIQSREIILDDKNGVTCCRYEAVVSGQSSDPTILKGTYTLTAGDRVKEGHFDITQGEFHFTLRALPPIKDVVVSNVLKVSLLSGSGEVMASDQKKFYVTSLVLP